MAPQLKLDPGVIAAAVALTAAIVYLFRSAHAEGYLDGITRTTGRRLHSVPGA